VPARHPTDANPLPADGWCCHGQIRPHPAHGHIGGQPFFGPPTLVGALGRSKAVYEAIDGTPTTREDLATQAPARHR
jgi:hypothetical protein